MKRRTAVTIAAVLVSTSLSLPVFADHVPQAPEGAIDFQGRSTLLLNTQLIDGIVEAQGRLEGPFHDLGYRACTVGGYMRVLPNLKVGLFYRLQAGARHDDDWIAMNPGWAWQDTTGRPEQVLMLDVSPRFLLDFLPGKDWVFMLKARYLLDTYDFHQSVYLRPGLTWFLLSNREPVLNLGLAYGLYVPLNFGTTLVYEHEPYVELLYHLNPVVKLELSGGRRFISWSTSRDALAKGLAPYLVTYSPWFIGAGVVINIDM